MAGTPRLRETAVSTSILSAEPRSFAHSRLLPPIEQRLDAESELAVGLVTAALLGKAIEPGQGAQTSAAVRQRNRTPCMVRNDRFDARRRQFMRRNEDRSQ